MMYLRRVIYFLGPGSTFVLGIGSGTLTLILNGNDSLSFLEFTNHDNQIQQNQFQHPGDIQ